MNKVFVRHKSIKHPFFFPAFARGSAPNPSRLASGIKISHCFWKIGLASLDSEHPNDNDDESIIDTFD